MSETIVKTRQVEGLEDRLVALEAAPGGGGEVNTASNLSGGLGWFSSKVGEDLRFKSVIAGTNVTIDSAANALTINASGGGSGEVNTASNLPGGEGLFEAKVGTDLQFKSLVAGSNVTLTPAADTVTIDADGGVNSITEHTATAGQTAFGVPGGYAVGNLLVYRNGVLLPSANYIATDGLNVVLPPSTLGDEVKIVSNLSAVFSLPSEIQYPYVQFWRDLGARIHEMNDRVMIGGAADNDGNSVPTIKDWLETERINTVKNSQFAVLSTIGQGAVLGGSRTSDFPFAGSMGCIGVQGWSINDNTTYVQTSYAAYFESRRKSGAGDTHGVEINVSNEGSVVDINPDSMFTSGLTAGLWVASGGELTVNNSTVAMAVLDNGTKFRKGIVFKKEALDPTTNIAIEMGQSQIVKWVSGANTAELYFDGTSIIMKKNGVTVATW
jgi:hypothetical protein